MTENPEPKFCCSLWLYYIRFPKTVVNKMKIKMTKFLNTSCRAGPPTGGGYRAGGQCPLPDRAVVLFKTKMRVSRRWFQLNYGRVIPPRKGPPILLGKQRAPLGGYPRGAPLDHFCILFLREKDGGQCPQPDGAVVPLATKTRATRQYYK